MITILADDFTGAAEVGAVALRYGLSAQVQDRFEGDVATDLGERSKVGVLVLNTHSRSLPPREAAAVVTETAWPLRRQAKWVYKKIDSVLRGPVVAEAQAALSALGLARALLVPANPLLGRTIRDGQYFIGGVPLHQTGFAADPEFPARTSDVLALLDCGKKGPVTLLGPGQALPARGIFVGRAASTADLAAWAAKVDATTLPVGGAEFLAAVLEAKGHTRVPRPAQPPLENRRPMLLVCGSSPPHAAETVRQARAHGVAVLPMPAELLAEKAAEADGTTIRQRWADEVVEVLTRRGSAVVSIGEGADRGGCPQTMLDRLADVVAAVLGRMRVGHVCMEGGATAWTLVRRLGWRRFNVRRELAPGVASLQVIGGGPAVTIKPGSYAWPEEIWS
ncbi:MAG: four-carbon acid sugar kinase family protein [Phycisphaerae bacterium]|jgi:uncharacterized protein YgbK (DUF1537 family)